MTRLYLKIFFTFWVITALIIVATNLLVHWLDLAPNAQLHKHRYDKDYEPARRLLFQMVGSAINRDTDELISDMRAMPEWSTRYFYIVDEEGMVRNPVVINNANPDFVMPALLAAIHTEWRPLQSAEGEIVYQKVTEIYQFYEGMDNEKQAPVTASNTEAKGEKKPKKDKKKGWNWLGKKNKDAGEAEEE